MPIALLGHPIHCGLTAGLLAALLLAAPAPAQESGEYRDNEAVSARYPEPDVTIDTPAFAKPEVAFTTYDEMTAYLSGLGLRMVELGRSQNGRAIQAVIFTQSGTDADFDDPAKPTVLLIAQQHGNEPAGGEAMLASAARLKDGDLAPLLGRINIVMIPRANPDGAEAFARTTENGVDVNRDHTLNRIPEGQAIGKAFRDYAPEVVFDAHEFSVAGRWPKAFGGVQRIDAMIQYATTANLSQHLVDLQENIFRQAIVDAFAAEDLTLDWYYTTNSDGSSQVLRMGGIGADTGRNVAGLRGAVSFLMEGRGVGIGTQHYKRRVFTEMVGVEAILTAAADNAELVLQETAATREEVAGRAPGTPFVILSEQTPDTRDIVFVDPETGEDLPKTVEWKSSLVIEPKLSRPRPAAYVLGPGNAEAAGMLERLGVDVMTLAAPASAEGSAYRILELAEGAKKDVRGVDTGAGQIVKGRFELAPQRLDLPAGAFLVPMDQPLANLAGIVLEPESPVGYVANRFIPVGGEVIDGLYRIDTAEALEALGAR